MEEIVRIDRMSYGSAAVASLPSGKTVFVEGGVPGDVDRIRITEEKPTFARAALAEVVEPSPLRVETPACTRTCGGCPWADIDYPAQLEAKRANVVSALVRTGHMPADAAEAIVRPAVASKKRWGYRNKIELAVCRDGAGRFTLGFHREGTHEVDPVSVCPLANRLIEKAPKALTGALRFLEGADDLGIFRVGVRGSVRTGDVEVALWSAPSAFPRAAAAKTVTSALKCTSVVRVIAEVGASRKVKKVETLHGKGCWEEKFTDGTVFLTSAPAFFQVNTAQAEKLVELACEGLDVQEGSYIADLYAGGGTFSVPFAERGADVVAVESSGPSVRDLRRNAELNGVEVEVVGGDAAREILELGELDGLAVDPPRAGLAKGMAAAVAQASPRRFVYVSCDPQTWARDVAALAREGYSLISATPVDMFPQTFHIETVSVFERASDQRRP